MVWDDRPQWEKNTTKGNMTMENENKGPTRPRMPWANQVKGGKRSAASPSSIVSGYWLEDAKRNKGEDNEIDIAEIKAAIKGVKNRWLKVVHKHPDAFKKLTESGKYDWPDLQGLLDGN